LDIFRDMTEHKNIFHRRHFYWKMLHSRVVTDEHST